MRVHESARREQPASRLAVRFGILGELEVRRGEERLELGGRRQRAVLALLLIEANRVVSIDRLAEELWGGRPPARATGTLCAYVSRLRRALEPERPRGSPGEHLATAPPGYVLRIGQDQLDSLRFERLAQQGRAALGAGEPEQAQARLGEALSLWRGAALSEFAYEPFAQAEAARLEELRLCASEDRLEAEFVLGRHAAIVAELEALVAAHPLRERLRGQLMLALYRSGRQAEALETYHAGRRLLSDQLGIDPSPELRALEEAILNQRPELDWRPPAGEKRARPVPAGPPNGNGKPPAVPSVATTFVGRAREISSLEGSLTTLHAGRGLVLLIAGEPGIGKTRLAEELSGRARALGAGVLWGRCFEGKGAPAFWPWMEVVRAVAECTEPEALRDALDSGAGELAQVFPELAEIAPAMAPQQVFDAEAARFRLYDSLTRFLCRLAASRPLVIVLDDLQWADRPSLELLVFLGARLRGAPILIAGAYRDVEVGPPHPLADALAELAREPATARLELQGLGQGEVAHLIAEARGGEPSETLVAAVHDRTDGNPFFVAQLVRLLESEGELEGAGAESSLRRDVPGGVRDVIHRRLARLPEESVRLLTLAAVIGEEFELALLAEGQELDDERALELVEAALLYRIVCESAEAVGRYRFSHALIRETLYGELSAMRRARLHRRVGEALERLHRDDESYLPELAHHFYEAAPAGVGQKAFSHALRAAEQAAGRLAYEQSEEQLRRALELLAHIPSSRERAERELEAQLKLSELFVVTKGYAAPEVGEASARARELCSSEVGESEQLLESVWRLSMYHCVRADFEAAWELGEQVLEVAHGCHEQSLVLAGHVALGIIANHRGEPALGLDHLRQVAELSESFRGPSVHHPPTLLWRWFSAWSLCLLGEEERACELTREALPLARDLGRPVDEAAALYFEAWIAVFRRDAALARQRAEETIALSSERGFPFWAAMTRILRGWALAELGEPDLGVAEIGEGLDAMESTGARMLRHYYLTLLAEAHRQAGQLEEALGAVDQGLAEAKATGERFYEAELYRLRGELLLALRPDETAAAEASLREALAGARSRQEKSLELRAEASLHRMLGQ